MSEKPKFTPGPWKFVRVKEDIDTFAIRTEDDDTLAAVGISPVGWKPGKDIANAALIAAAPEMYVSLKDMVLTVTDLLDAICSGEENTDCLLAVVQEEIDNAVKVLKKARGEE